jgi:hypothetical protein
MTRVLQSCDRTQRRKRLHAKSPYAGGGPAGVGALLEAVTIADVDGVRGNRRDAGRGEPLTLAGGGQPLMLGTGAGSAGIHRAHGL